MQLKTGNADHKETIRLETFSDGVFCIAITLLSFDIGADLHHVVNNTGLQQILLAKWPIIFAYILSFVNVLLAWMGHHDLFRHLRGTNSKVMIANGILLMLVALVPFPTKVLGIYLQSGALKTAVVFYTGYFVLISMAFKLLWHAASKNKTLLAHDITREKIQRINTNENTGLICNGIITGIALVNPWAALALSLVMWIYWILIA